MMQSPLLDLPPFPADRYGPLADRIKALLSTRNDVVFVQAEAILALEAAATSLGRPGLVALNIVTSPYGGYFGQWLHRAGANVHTLEAEPGLPVTAEAVRAVLGRLPQVDLVAMVHAETSSGIVNPLADIAALVQARDALLVVDAVASLGGHPLDVDGLGIDVCVIGAQKALAGPAGLSMLSISPRAWAAMPHQPAPSSLAVLDLKTNWLDRGRGVVPGMPSATEFWALDAALERVDAEGLGALVARHQRAAAATRAGIRELGVGLWIEDDAQASTLATAIRIPSGSDAGAFLRHLQAAGGAASPGFGAVRDSIVRLDHTGRRANPDTVLANLLALAGACGIAADAGRLRSIATRQDEIAQLAAR